MRQYDMLVIGSGPGGEKAAIQGSKLGKRVAIIERRPYIGGAGLHTGTLPSKTLRETALFLSSFKQRAVFGFQFTLGREVRLGELSFTNERPLMERHDDGTAEKLTGKVIVIAAGKSPARPPDIPFDAEHI